MKIENNRLTHPLVSQSCSCYFRQIEPIFFSEGKCKKGLSFEKEAEGTKERSCYYFPLLLTKGLLSSSPQSQELVSQQFVKINQANKTFY